MYQAETASAAHPRSDRTFEHMPWGFSFAFDHWDEAERCRVDFDTRMHDPAGVRSFVDRVQRLA
ncbi:MAG: hypothetical protein QOH11_2720, partial [Solirubrobacteraceae bacterium]|nr:hypothetical protein [Solirubrobacteraceae bacterium]